MSIEVTNLNESLTAQHGSHYLVTPSLCDIIMYADEGVETVKTDVSLPLSTAVPSAVAAEHCRKHSRNTWWSPACVMSTADDSTSMKYADKGERIDDLKLILERVTEARFCLKLLCKVPSCERIDNPSWSASQR